MGDKKIFLIIDNLKVHHGIICQEFVYNNEDKIELFLLPAYSPRMNPVEAFNNLFKSLLKKFPIAKTQAEFTHNVKCVLMELQNKPDLIESLFGKLKLNIFLKQKQPFVLKERKAKFHSSIT
ncbi:MAG: transposase [Deltaproteobacteria bacterium]|nr:transposase [Deltaproteobacteria bacterium]